VKHISVDRNADVIGVRATFVVQGCRVGEGVALECTEDAFSAARLQTYYVTFVFPKDSSAIVRTLLN
jgi:hypothetical protein